MRQITRVTFAMRDLDRLKCIQAVVGFFNGNRVPGKYWVVSTIQENLRSSFLSRKILSDLPRQPPTDNVT
jgi:hypothetical protein